MKSMKLKNYFLSIGVMLLLLSCGGGSDDSPSGPIDPGGNTPVVPDENFDDLVWSDEFDVNGSPDAEKWTYDLGDGCPDLCGWGNNEEQYYTNRTENVKVEDGLLKITAIKESFEGAKYTSTRLLTQGKYEFTYGRLEVKAKLPGSGGTWPAIWMLGSNISSRDWPACGEIDIMEQTGADKEDVSSALHTPSSFGNTMNKGNQTVKDAVDEFHVYTVEWKRKSIVFSVDGIVHYSYGPSNQTDRNWPFYADQFIILNVAMGGTLGGNVPNDFDESSMEIDYVRVYQ